jgi:hypothetical protein
MMAVSGGFGMTTNSPESRIYEGKTIQADSRGVWQTRLFKLENRIAIDIRNDGTLLGTQNGTQIGTQTGVAGSLSGSQGVA